MAEPIKSALLVDYDSLHRSLTAAGGEIADRLASRAGGWIAAIESGQLIGPERTRRHITVKRCYADPQRLGDGRDDLATADFEVVDCVADAGGARRPELHIAIDAISELGQPAGCDEFILLSGEASLAPLLTRLKASKRRTAIYADAATAPGYRALADAFLEVASLMEFLALDEAAAASAASTIDRSEIEAFARKIHAATNIPLFSPKTFAELFGYLADEIAIRGYHFQTTAKNVADRLVETGRSVTRRQVVFIVKGLALKGHVFSTNDTPRRLAQVFLEQANYLIQNTGLTLDGQQERLLAAWLVGRVPFTSPAPAVDRAKAANVGPPAVQPAAMPAQTAEPSGPSKQARLPPVRPENNAGIARPGPDGRSAETPPPPPADPGRVARPPELSSPRDKTATAVPKPLAKPAPAMLTPEDAKAAIAARIPASVRSREASRTPAPPPADDRPTAKSEKGDAARGSIESSILAAIAEAVDVLVEDSGGERGKTTRAAGPPAKKRNAPPPEPKTRPEPRPARHAATEGGDIGDEIQRIIATYNRDRKDASRK